MSPCDRCKRSECPEKCRPWIDYVRGKRKRGDRNYEPKGGRRNNGQSFRER